MKKFGIFKSMASGVWLVMLFFVFGAEVGYARQCTLPTCSGSITATENQMNRRVSICSTTGAATRVNTLAQAIARVNNGTNTGNIYIIVNTGAAVTADGVVINDSGNASGANYTSITIRGDGGTATLTNSSATTNITLDGADNVCFENLIITNTSNTGAVSFTGTTNNNRFTSCTIKSDVNSATAGVVSFAGTSTGNIISACTIEGNSGTPRIGIYSDGSTITNTVQNSTIRNYFNSTSASSGIWLAAGNTGWTISNNDLFQSATRNHTSSVFHTGIRIESGSDYTISSNRIGGTGRTGITITGDYTMTYTATAGSTNDSPVFAGIYIAGSVASNATSLGTISQNTISRIIFNTESSRNSTSSAPYGAFQGIFLGNHPDVSGDGNTGGATISNNTVSTISLNSTQGEFVGLYSSLEGQVTCSNVDISSVSVNHITNNGANLATGIGISNNILGATLSGCDISGIICGIASTVDLDGRIYGIEVFSTNTGGGTVSIQTCTLTDSHVRGLSRSGTSLTSIGILAVGASVVCSGNTITNYSAVGINGANQNLLGTTVRPALVGIVAEATGSSTVSGNTLTNLLIDVENASAHANPTYVAGIFVNGTATVTGNTINGLQNKNTTNAASAAIGILRYNAVGTATINGSNSITISASTRSNIVAGVWTNGNSVGDIISSNTIVIGGSSTNQGYGIYRNGSDALSTATMNSNSITITGSYNTVAGIFSNSTANETISSNNPISINGTGTTIAYGINKAGLLGIPTIESNVITGMAGSYATAYGIHSASATDGKSISSNQVTMTTAGTTTAAGVYHANTAGTGALSSNQVSIANTHTTARGVWTLAGGETMASNTVTISGTVTTGQGIYRSNATSSGTISANTITMSGAITTCAGIQTDGAGEAINGTNNITVSGANTTAYGIYRNNASGTGALSSNSITFSNTRTTGRGIFTTGGGGAIASNTIVMGGTNTTGQGIYRSNATSSGTISGNTITMSGTIPTCSGIQTDGAGEAINGGNTVTLSGTHTTAYGVYRNNTSGTGAISSNTVNSTAAATTLYGIHTTGAGEATNSNTIGFTAGATTNSYGIFRNAASGTGSIASNIISMTNSFATSGSGIHTNSSGSAPSKNRVYIASGAGTPMVYGVRMNGGSGTGVVSNNMVSLADNYNEAYGLWYAGGAANLTYSNTIYISGGTTRTSGIFREASAGGEVKNNLVWNNASNGNRDCINSNTGADFNTLIRRNGIPTTGKGIHGWAGQTTTLDFPSTSSTDLFTSVTNPGTTGSFLRIVNTSALAWLVNGKGDPRLGITDDIDGTARRTDVASGPIDIGADEVAIATAPRVLSVSATPGTFTYANQNIATISWVGGTMTGATMQYYSGEDSHDASGLHGRSYWVIDPVGGTPTTYTMSINYGSHEIGGAPSTGMEKKTTMGSAWKKYSLTGGDCTGTKPTTSITSANLSARGVGSIICESTFSIVAPGEESLPITLLHFNAKPAGRSVLTEWATAVEEYNEFFTVERSANGRDFTAIAQVPGAVFSTNTLNYSHYDEEPLPGTSYYRLKQTDTDGSFSYSKVAVVNRANEGEITLEAYPNPSQGNVTLQFSEGSGQVHIYNLLGQLVFSAPVGNTRHIEVSLQGKGVFNVQYLHETGKASKRVVVE